MYIMYLKLELLNLSDWYFKENFSGIAPKMYVYSITDYRSNWMNFEEIGLTKQLNRWSKIEGWHQYICVYFVHILRFNQSSSDSSLDSVRKNAKKRFFQWERMQKNYFFFSGKECEKTSENRIFSVDKIYNFQFPV